MMKAVPEFGSVITAMVTPFKENGELDYALAVELGEYLIENGSDAIVLSGTTGESPTLTHDEEFELYRILIKGLRGKVPIIAGTGSNCTRTAIASTQEAEKIGVDASLQVVPYYNKPSQEGLFQHFQAIAQSTNLPIFLYNIPGRTSRELAVETIERLSHIPNIIGIKEASGDVEIVKQIRACTDPSFQIYSGDDALTLAFMAAGAKGVVSVGSHVAGLQIKEMIEAFLSGNHSKAEEINALLAPLFAALFMTTNPAPVKAALRLLGFGVGIPRLPLVDVTAEEKSHIESVLDAFLESVAS